jgi:uncharacterized protein
MSRILFWILLIGLVAFAVRAKIKAGRTRQQQAMRQQQRQQPQAPLAEIEDMAQCAYCGIHFPASEAVRAEGHDYCSPGHVRLPPR